MKILHIIDSCGIYGAEIMLLNLIEEQQKMDLSPVLVSIGNFDSKENALEEEAKRRQFEVLPFRMRRGYSLRAALDLVRMAHKDGISVIHSHGYKGNILIGSLPRRIRKIPMVRTIHGWTATKKLSKMWFYEAFDKRTLRNMDAVVRVCVPETGKEDVRYLQGTRQVTIENGIRELKFYPESVYRSDPEVSRFCSDGFIIGTLSRLSDEKGLVHLISAMRILSSHQADFKALIIGEGPQKEFLQDKINDAGLSKKVMLTGYRERAYNYLPLFKIFVLPSLTEGLPMTILEAMQARIPIIATRVGGIPEVLEHGKAGILVEPEDPQSLADAVTRLWSDPNGAKEMADNARATALNKYSSRRMAEDYLRLYETVVKK